MENSVAVSRAEAKWREQEKSERVTVSEQRDKQQ